MLTTPDTLASLPPHVLAHITGDRRRKLVDYLLRWGEPEAALACLDTWLAEQPHLATLRESRAGVLLELGRPAEALHALEELDAERGPSEGRRVLQMRAIGALGRWREAHLLLDDQADTASEWRLRADLLRREGRFDQAAQAYARAAELMPEGSDPLRGLAELALAQGDPARAQALLRQRQERLPDAPPATRDLLMLREAAALLDDAAEFEALDQQIQERRAAEDAALRAQLGLDAPAAEPADLVPQVPLADEPGLAEAALVALQEHFGFDVLRPGQAAVVDGVLRDRSVLAVLPTGAGKSLTYQLPALLLDGATLVISPLIALMKDQLDNLPPALAERATTINSALGAGEVGARLRGIAAGQYKLIYVAPERLRQQPFVQALRSVGVARVVVDEAHCVSLWGINFRPDYLFIRSALDQLGVPPVLALTATATPETEAEIKAHLGDLETVRTSIFRPNLRFEVVHVENKHDKLEAVVELCQEIDGPVVVYVRSRDGCEEVAGRLRQSGVAAEHYHAQVSDRAAVQDRFMRGATRVLVATVAFGMGVDKADVRAIIHYNLPSSVEAYYQEAGRAGRDGLPSRCVLLYAPNDKGQLTSWLREEAITKDYLRDVYRWLRRHVAGVWGIVALDDLRRDLREDDETRLRVTLGLLERVGLLERHFDLPRGATIVLHENPADADLHALVGAAELRPGQPREVNLIDVAERLGCAPDELERRLLRWRAQGLLRYDGSARDVLIQLRPAGADVSERIDALLAEYADRQNARVEAIAAYARGVRCRHRALAEHFGERLAPCGAACDICAPAEGRRPKDGRRKPHPSSPVLRPSSRHSPSQITAAILDAVGELPGQLNDKDLVCVLLGMPGFPESNAYGRLAGADYAATRGVVSSLVAAGRLAYRRRALVATNGAPRPLGPQFAEEIILRCIANLPFAVGRSGLGKILKGAAGSPIGPDRCADFAALAHLTGAAIEAQIEQLVERGLLQRSGGQRPLLMLSERGAALLHDAHAEALD